MHVQRDYQIFNVKLEEGRGIAARRSLLTVGDVTVICRGENTENSGQKSKETDCSSLGLEFGRCWFDE